MNLDLAALIVTLIAAETDCENCQRALFMELMADVAEELGIVVVVEDDGLGEGESEAVH